MQIKHKVLYAGRRKVLRVTSLATIESGPFIAADDPIRIELTAHFVWFGYRVNNCVHGSQNFAPWKESYSPPPILAHLYQSLNHKT